MDKQQVTDGAAGTGIDALRKFVARLAATDRYVTTQLDAAAAEVLAAFEAAGIDALLLKGAGLARLLYTADERRGYCDVDLLVAPRQFDAAGRSLAALGYLNGDGHAGVDDVGGIVHDQTWLRTGRLDQTMIELHRWLPGSGASAQVSWEALWARRVRIEVGGRPAAVLDRDGQAMHLAIHAAQHGPSYAKQINELALALERWPTDVWDSAVLLAQEIGATATFAAGLRLVPQGAAEVARLGLPPTAELDWTIRHRESRPRGTFHLQAFGQAQNTRERLAIVRRSLLPGRQWILHEHGWVGGSGVRMMAAYGVHLVRAPAWAARAWLFGRRARRAANARRP